jgi:acetyl-CoA acetyltransferase
VHRGELSAQVLSALVQRAGVDAEVVDDVMSGSGGQANATILELL